MVKEKERVPSPKRSPVDPHEARALSLLPSKEAIEAIRSKRIAFPLPEAPEADKPRSIKFHL